LFIVASNVITCSGACNPIQIPSVSFQTNAFIVHTAATKHQLISYNNSINKLYKLIELTAVSLLILF